MRACRKLRACAASAACVQGLLLTDMMCGAAGSAGAANHLDSEWARENPLKVPKILAQVGDRRC